MRRSRIDHTGHLTSLVRLATAATLTFIAACSPSPAPPATSADGTAAPRTAAASGPTLPFKLELVEVTGSTLPALHSFSSATSNGKWLIIGGRTAGLHGFGSGTNNFPRSTANTVAYVIDPATNTVDGSVDLVAALPAKLAGPLTATNPEFVQVGTSLYIVGGYGKDLTTAQGNMTTFGSVVKVDVPGLIQAIVNKTSITSFFAQSPESDNRLKVTGGGLGQANGTFYLAFGQDFTGDYSIENSDYNRAGGQFQKYTEKVRIFTLASNLSISTFSQADGGYDPSLPYHRRDLNMTDIIQADGHTPGATVYGGVFMAGQVAGHTTPIDINYTNPASPVTLQTGFHQALNQYDCARLTIFDQASASSFTTFLGGISQYHYDSASNVLVRDQLDLQRGVDGLPFITTISTIQRGPAAAFSQYIQPTPLPTWLGADGQFLIASGVPVFDNGVIQLASLQGRTLVGYMYGGIQSGGPYSTLVTTQPGTAASNRLFQIYITPGATAVIAMPPLPTKTTPWP